MNAEAAHIIQLPVVPDARGNLSFFEFPSQLPFPIKRTYWIHDIPGGENKGHAFKNQQEFIVALSGSLDLMVHDGVSETTFTLNRSNFGILVPKMHWRKLQNIATNTVILIVSDSTYDENDYIRKFDEFLKATSNV